MTTQSTLYTNIRRTISLGVPFVVAQFLQMGIFTTDVIMVGQLGALPLGAITIGAQLIFVFTIFAMGFAIAIMPLAAEALGRKDERTVRRAVRMGFWQAIIVSLLFLPILWFASPILTALKQIPEVVVEASKYVRIAMFALVFNLLLNVFRSFYSALERPEIITWISLFGFLSNILVNYTLIYGHFGFPAMGAQGAAVASVLTTAIMFLAAIVYYLRHEQFNKYQLFHNFSRFDPEIFVKLLKMGFPIGIAILSEVSMFAVASLFVGTIGVNELAAHGIVLQVSSIAFMIPLGLSNVATVRVGNAYGRGDLLDIRLALRAVILVAVGFAVMCALLFVTIPEFLAGLFIKPDTANASDVILFASAMLLFSAIFQISDTIQVNMMGALRGLQDVFMPSVLAMICYWPIGMAMCYYLGIMRGFGGEGVWAGLVIGLTTAAIALSLRYFWQLRRLKAGWQPQG